MGQQLRELPQHVFLHFDRRVAQQWLQGLQVGALGEHCLEGARGLGLQVLARLLVHHARQQVSQHVTFRQCPRVVGRMAADLPQRPCAGALDVVFGLRDKRFLQWRDALGYYCGQSESF